MKLPIEIVVAILAGISCLIGWPGLGLPVWALFIGWAWYFALGATPAVMKKIYPSILPGIVLGAVCILLINNLATWLPVMLAIIIAVIITVYLLMLALKVSWMNSSLPAFNAYSTMFATYYGGFYPQHLVSDTMTAEALLLAVLWAIIGNALGPVFGYLSVRLSRSE